MKLGWLFLALSVESIVYLTRAQVTGAGGRSSAIGAGISKFAAEGLVDLGIGNFHAIAPEEKQVAQGLIEEFEADSQPTGEIPCLPRPCRERKRGTRPTLRNGGLNCHQMELLETLDIETRTSVTKVRSPPSSISLAQLVVAPRGLDGDQPSIFDSRACRDFLSTVCFLPLALLHRVLEDVRNVEVGHLQCDSLKDAPDATLLRFAVSSTEVRGEDQVAI